MSDKDQEEIDFHSDAATNASSLSVKNYHRRELNKIYFRLREQNK